MQKLYLWFIIFLFIACMTNLLSSAKACLSITDDYNFPNPTLNANFSILPDVSPFTDCWSGAFRIRGSQTGWRLIANRQGPDPISVMGDTNDNVKASDVSLEFTVKSFGNAPPGGAILVSPFTSKTDLSSIQSGTFILTGIKKSSNSCSPNNPNFYKLNKTLCLFHDFVFNPGEYNAQVSYLLVSP